MPRPDDRTGDRTGDLFSRQQLLLLREAVRRHAATEHRRRFAPVLHVGRPGVRERTAPASLASSDHALRIDLVAALVACSADPEPLVWLTRSGDLSREDLDAAWSSAARAAGGEAGRHLRCLVVTRHGWRDPVTGGGRTWRRIRA